VNRYQLTFARSARKELEALPASVVARVFPRIEALADTPRPVGSHKLRGEKNLWRIRVGEYRVIHSVDDRVALSTLRQSGSGARRIANAVMPMTRKIRELIRDLEAAGFVDRGGKGDHRNFTHPKVAKPVTISGKPGDDAKHYQEKAVRVAIEESKR